MPPSYETRHTDPPHDDRYRDSRYSRDSHDSRDSRDSRDRNGRARRQSTGARRPHRFMPLDPRPGKADQEMRKARLALEKEKGYDWTPAVLLGVMGLTTILSFDKAYEKYQQRNEEKGQREEEGRKNRARREGREGFDDEDGGRRRSSERGSESRRYHDDDLGGYYDDDYYSRRGSRRGRSRDWDYDRDLDEGYPRGRSVDDRYRSTRRESTW